MIDTENNNPELEAQNAPNTPVNDGIDELVVENTAPIISLNKLLEAGVYFGHKKDRWNPKMAPFIHGIKNGIHIIDVNKTYKAIEVAYKLVGKMAERGASFIFVGTKKNAKEVIKEQAIRTGSPYVNERWLGGTLTNSKTIFSRVRTLEDLEELAARNFEGYTKKEGVLMRKKMEKLQRNLNGIRDMQRVPQFMIVADPNEDLIAVKEARKKNVKVIGVIDTNTNPDLVDLGIPANDDSLKSINVIITLLADAIMESRGGTLQYAYKADEAIVLPVDQNANPNRMNRRDANLRRFNRNQGDRQTSEHRFERRPFNRPDNANKTDLQKTDGKTDLTKENRLEGAKSEGPRNPKAEANKTNFKRPVKTDGPKAPVANKVETVSSEATEKPLKKASEAKTNKTPGENE